MRRTLPMMLGLLVAAAACDEGVSTPVEPQFSSAAATGPAGAATYSVTITNLSSGQPFTPPLAAVHRQPVSLFEMGQPASVGVQQIAENGNLAPLIEYLDASKHVAEWSVTEGPTLPPVLPGESVTFMISGDTGAKYFSFVSMLICTNDGFTGVSGHRLPKAVGDYEMAYLAGYDAGTEINTEDFADLVPPCAPLTGQTSMDMGTGMSNPELAENGVVMLHEGISGDDDLDPSVHGWMDPIAMITIERMY